MSKTINQTAKAPDYTEFGAMADNMTLQQLQTFQRKALEAHKALQELEDLAGSPEPLSHYIGISYSLLVEEVENLACAVDSRIMMLEDLPAGTTYNTAPKA